MNKTAIIIDSKFFIKLKFVKVKHVTRNVNVMIQVLVDNIMMWGRESEEHQDKLDVWTELIREG